jgi:hypothetical protein
MGIEERTVVERKDEIELFPTRLVPQTHPDHKVYQIIRTLSLIDNFRRSEWSFMPSLSRRILERPTIHRSVLAFSPKLDDTLERVAQAPIRF